VHSSTLPDPHISIGKPKSGVSDPYFLIESLVEHWDLREPIDPLEKFIFYH
jgi:hypothetical protein